MSETVRYAGDIDIVHVSVISSKDQKHTITKQVDSFEIYEDLFSPFISGSMAIRDSHEFTSLLPFIGEEIIIITMKTPGGFEYKKSFSIYKMGDRTEMSKDNVVFTIHFMSKEGIIDQNRKISKGFYGDIAKESGDCIVRKLVEDPLGLNIKNSNEKKPIVIENSISQTRYVSNFWSPVQNLNYLTELTVTESDKPSPTYIFFENAKGFYFVSMESLYKNTYGDPEIPKFIWSKIPPDELDIEESYKHIINFDTPQTFDYMKRLQGGMYGTEVISYDILTKQYSHVGYKPEFDKTSHVNKYTPQSKDPPTHNRSQVIYVPKYFNNYDDYKDTTSAKHIQNRLGLMSSAESFKLNIVVNGKTNYRVGQIVDINFPLHTQMNEQLSKGRDMQDKVYSGKYLIAALCHKITKQKHVCTMEVIKDTYMVDTQENFFDP